MNRITVNEPLTSQLDALGRPVALCDENGRVLGHFVPAVEPSVSDDCPYTEEELARMRAEEGGRSLPEIWRTLGAK